MCLFTILHSLVLECMLNEGRNTEKPSKLTLNCGESYNYKCLAGYELSNTMVVCTKDGLLSPSTPQCQRKLYRRKQVVSS